MSEHLVSLLVEALSKRKGIPAEEAKKIVEAYLSSRRDRVKDFEEYVKRLESAKSVISSLPEEAKAPVALLLAKELLSATKQSLSPSDVMLVKEILSSLQGDSNEIAKLREEIRSIREELSKKSYFDDIRKEIEELRKAVSELKQQPQQQQVHQQVVEEVVKRLDERIRYIEEKLSKSNEFKSTAVSVLKELDELVQVMKKYGLIGNSGMPSVDKMIEVLKQYGYEVKRATLTEEDVSRIRDEVRKEVERELGVEKARAELVSNIIRDLIREVGSPIVKAFTEAQKEAIKAAILARLSQARGVQQEQRPQEVSAPERGGSSEESKQPG